MLLRLVWLLMRLSVLRCKRRIVDRGEHRKRIAAAIRCGIGGGRCRSCCRCTSATAERGEETLDARWHGWLLLMSVQLMMRIEMMWI